VLAAWLDRLLYRHPFEGASARRYAVAERPAFGDLDDRLLDRFADHVTSARRILDVGAGPATFATRTRARYPTLEVISIEPSRALSRVAATTGCVVVRAEGEALPIATASIDLAICLSSIRHVRDRGGALRELRRVVRPGGMLAIVELDPDADATRIATHANHLGSAVLRHAFAPLVVRTAPPVRAIETSARRAGWTTCTRSNDPVQPVYVLELA
jgi:ubiquinone/menaquinone biosynthesis C-methylase UbiE